MTPLDRNEFTASSTNRQLARARWWQVRRAQNRKPATYVCPLCGRYLPALSEHMLLVPEGDPRGRRHAHMACVLAARRSGKLPTRDDWLSRQQSSPGPIRRALLTGGRLIGRGR